MKKYKVLNYHNFISLPTEDERKPIFIEAGELTTLKPFSRDLTLDELLYINYRSEVFKTGRLEFLPEDQEELFEELGIDDSYEYVTAEQIMDTIKHPTKEKLEKVIAIKNLNTIDLFRGAIVSVQNTEAIDISSRVAQVINKRRDEIYRNPTAESKIKIKKTRTELETEAKEKAMQSAMDSALAKMKEELEAKYQAELNAKLAEMTKSVEEKVEEGLETQKKKVGRPPKKVVETPTE